MICLLFIVHLSLFIMCNHWICVFVYLCISSFDICAFVICYLCWPVQFVHLSFVASQVQRGWQITEITNQVKEAKCNSESTKKQKLERRSAPPPKSTIANSRRLSACCYSASCIILFLIKTILTCFAEMFEVAVVGDCWQYFWLYIICHCGSPPGSTEGEQLFWQIWQRTNTIPVYNFCIVFVNTTYKYGKGQIQYSNVFVSVFVFVAAQHHYDDENRVTF